MNKTKTSLRILSIIFLLMGTSILTEEDIFLMGIAFLFVALYLLFLAEF